LIYILMVKVYIGGGGLPINNKLITRITITSGVRTKYYHMVIILRVSWSQAVVDT